MMKIVALAAALALVPLASQGADIRLDKPLQGATLLGCETDMSVYYEPMDDATYRLHAVYVGKDAGTQPHELLMMLRDGDSVSFSMPGHMREIYHFSRNGDSIQIENAALADPAS